MQNGADISAVDSKWSNVLHLAASEDQPAPFYYFKTVGIDINSKDKDGSTPLHLSYMHKCEKIIPFILAQNPDVDA